MCYTALLYRMEGIGDLKPEKNYIVPILSIGIPSGLENGMFQIGRRPHKARLLVHMLLTHICFNSVLENNEKRYWQKQEKWKNE